MTTEKEAFDISILLNAFHKIWIGLIEQSPYIVIGILVFAAFIVIARLIKRLILAAGRRTRLQDSLTRLLGRLASATITIIGLAVSAVVVFPGFKPGDLVAGLGITSVAIGFAFKDILQNFFAGILILLRQPFVVGDQIRSGEYEGTVEEIDIRATRLKTYDGERVVLPNGDVFTRAILVRTAYHCRRIRFVVGIGYPDSIEKARHVISNVLSETDGVLKEPPFEVYVTELAPSSVNLTVYFWAEAQQANVLRVGDRVATGIKLALDEAGIDMPYPHAVVLLQAPSAGPETKLTQRPPNGD
jgi:small conductance mechanosensitive channel